MLHDEGSEAWQVAPGVYGAAHPPRYADLDRWSRYVEVRDGTRLAVDVHLPRGPLSPEAFPAIVLFTPYYRRFRLRPGHDPATESSPNTAIFRDAFLPHGYAIVTVDIRGCGASFGTRDGFRSPRERDDYHDIASWIAAQSWCNGVIGSVGISYVGAAADFLASTGHPAVKAVIPAFAVWDTWSNHHYPGGVLMTHLLARYEALSKALDQDHRDILRTFAYFLSDDYAGPAPVDADADGDLLRQAITEHAANFNLVDFTQQLRFRDAGLTDNPAYSSAVISPYHYASRAVDQRVAYYCVSGWMDGSGFATAAIQRFLWLQNPSRRLLIGPWDHGGRTNVSPWRAEKLPRFRLLDEYLRFFDTHLKGMDAGLADEAPVHYFTMGAERWRAADGWPPPHMSEVPLYFAENGKLEESVPTAADACDSYAANYACGTGTNTRYERLHAADVQTYYGDWHGRDAQMLTYTSAPLDAPKEVTGHPVAHLHLTASERDAAVFAYIEDVDRNGQCRYVTEGMFRAQHRRPGLNPPTIPATGPTHTFAQADAALLTPGEPAELAFELFPTSYQFAKGHRIRIAIAGADSDHFSRIPDGRPPRFDIHRSAARPSHVLLPMAD